ncbi:hypothetical protein, partial [Escherichia coli]|uniref:hypothetical protein n=1 Tax=Escherichia coli TaxID=562 RepID=UPI001BEB20E8
FPRVGGRQRRTTLFFSINFKVIFVPPGGKGGEGIIKNVGHWGWGESVFLVAGKKKIKTASLNNKYNG